MTEAARLIEWLGGLEVTSGPRSGERFRVLPWQRRFLYGMLKPDITTAALSVGRGNGKTTLVGAIAAAVLAGPLRRRGGLVLVVSASIEQARVAAQHAERFLHGIEGELLHRDGWSVQRAGVSPKIKHRPSWSELRCVAANPKTLHGFEPSLVLMDEPAQWAPSRSREVLEVLRTSTGKTPAKLVALGTRAADDATWWAQWCRGEGVDYSQVHAASMKLKAGHRRTWQRANPSLDHFPLLEERIRAEWRLAMRDPDALASFRALRLNQGVRPVEEAMLIDASAWEAVEVPPGLYPDPPAPDSAHPQVWGVDTGGSAAMSAIARYDLGSQRLDVLASFPSVPDLSARGLRDGVGNLYRKMEAEGNLITTGGKAADYVELVAEAKRRWGVPSLVVADRWRAAEFSDAMTRNFMLNVPAKLRGMGFKDGAADVEGFRKAVLEHRVMAPKSLLLRTALMEARVVMDGAGNAKLAKQAESGRRMRARDDAAAAAILAVAEGCRMRRSQPLGLPRLVHVGAP